MKDPFKTMEPGYKKLERVKEALTHEEVARVRMRTEFKNKLKSLTVKHDPNQEYCEDCPTLTPGSPSGPSLVSLRRTSTTATLGPQPKVNRRWSRGHEERSYGFSSESTEYFKAHPELATPLPNPKRIPHDEVRNIMACFTDLHVAHEIAINQCFRLKPLQSEDKVAAEMKQVFWELFQEEVESQKSACNQTLAMISELKETIHSLMMPHNHDLRDQVNQVLDLDRLRKEVTKNRFDYDCYSQYILDILLQICCPSRDLEIEEIRKIKDVVEQFKRIFKLVEDMKDDMENFFINLFRPTIVKMSVENERKKFADYLELEYRLNEDGLRGTRSWLMRHRVGVRDTMTIIAKAYGEIFYWTTNEPWPETLMEDIQRFQKLRLQLDRIGIVGGVILEVGKICQQIFRHPPPGLRILFSKYMKLLIPQSETEDDTKLKTCLEKVAVKAVEATEMVITKYMNRAMKSEEKEQIQTAVLRVLDKNNHFRCLILRRTIDYAEEVIIAAQDYHTAVPSTLSAVMYEVAILISEFHRIILHNRACFEELYRDICEDINKTPLFPDENAGNWDNGLLDSLKKLRSPIATPAEAAELARRASELYGNLREEEQYLESVFGSDQKRTSTTKDNRDSADLSDSNKSNETSSNSNKSKNNNNNNNNDDDTSGKLNSDENADSETRRASQFKKQNDTILRHEKHAFRNFCRECKDNGLEFKVDCSTKK